MENVSSYIMFLLLLNFQLTRKGRYTETENYKKNQMFFPTFFKRIWTLSRLSCSCFHSSRMPQVWVHPPCPRNANKSVHSISFTQCWTDVLAGITMCFFFFNRTLTFFFFFPRVLQDHRLCGMMCYCVLRALFSLVVTLPPTGPTHFLSNRLYPELRVDSGVINFKGQMCASPTFLKGFSVFSFRCNIFFLS